VLQRDLLAPWLPLPTPKPITATDDQVQARKIPAFVSVLRPPSGLSIATWAKLFVAHARYHRKLGFAATIIYARDSMIETLAGAPSMEQAILNREIFLVRWDDVAPFPADPLQVYDQVSANSVNCCISLVLFYRLLLCQSTDVCDLDVEMNVSINYIC
jgi:hypothetical protein